VSVKPSPWSRTAAQDIGRPTFESRRVQPLDLRLRWANARGCYSTVAVARRAPARAPHLPGLSSMGRARDRTCDLGI